jgi:hypothetical protein
MACAIAALILLFSGCEAEDTKLEGEDPGPNTSFLIKVSVDADIAKNFTHRRVTVQIPDGSEIGNTARINTSAGVRYRLTLPSSYMGQDAKYIVEFRRENSGLDKAAAIKKFPMILELLKSRYYVIDGKTPESSGEEVTLGAIYAGSLGSGYGPGGLSLTDIPQSPIVYFLQPDTSGISAISSYQLEIIGGAATAPDNAPITPADSTDDLIDSDGVVGVTSKDFDWAMIMTPGKYDELGEPFTVWFFMKQPNSQAASAYCPCTDCDCDPVCPYKIMTANGKPVTFARINIAPPYNIENGDTIVVDMTDMDIIECAGMPAAD